MKVVAALISFALIIYVIVMIFAYGAKLIRSKKRLANLQNPIRRLTEEEKYLLRFYESFYKATLQSDAVYAMEGVLEISGYTFKGNTQMSIRLNGVNVNFPYDLQTHIKDDHNQVELVILKGRGVMVGVVVQMNGVSLEQVGREYWGYDRDYLSLNQYLGKRQESGIERRFRLSRIFYAPSAIFLALGLASLLIAAWSRGTVYTVFFALGGALLALCAGSALRTYWRHRKPQEVIRLKSVLRPIGIFDARNASQTLSGVFAGTQYQLNTKPKKLWQVPPLGEESTYNESALVALELTPSKKRTWQVLRADDLLISEDYRHHGPLPHGRLLVFLTVTLTAALGFYLLLQNPEQGVSPVMTGADYDSLSQVVTEGFTTVFSPTQTSVSNHSLCAAELSPSDCQDGLKQSLAALVGLLTAALSLGWVMLVYLWSLRRAGNDKPV